MRDSFKAVSGRPTISKPGMPLVTSTSTVTRWDSIPTRVEPKSLASKGPPGGKQYKLIVQQYKPAGKQVRGCEPTGEAPALLGLPDRGSISRAHHGGL